MQVAADLAGLRPGGYVAAAALVMALQVQEPTEPGEGGGAGERAGRRARLSLSSPEDRELLAELIQARLARRRFGTNVNQAAAVHNSGGQVPVWLSSPPPALTGRWPGSILPRGSSVRGLLCY